MKTDAVATTFAVADIGGTHARFAIAAPGPGGTIELGNVTKLATADHGSLAAAWTAFGQCLGHPLPRAAAIAVAAPVTSGDIRMTNNSWIIEPGRLNVQLGLDDHIILNDFAAVAHAVHSIPDKYLLHLFGPDGPLPDHGTISVIGPGTGLGVAALQRAGKRTHVIATEGGHAGFAPVDAFEDRLLARLRARHDRVSVERVVSGPGLRAIAETLVELGAEAEDMSLAACDDRALWTHALEGTDRLAAAALERFAMCLGSAAGDVALMHGPGPVVIAGGLGLRIGTRLGALGFHDRFCAKGRYRELMRSLPVKLITHPEPGLYGAGTAWLARQA